MTRQRFLFFFVTGWFPFWFPLWDGGCRFPWRFVLGKKMDLRFLVRYDMIWIGTMYPWPEPSFSISFCRSSGLFIYFVPGGRKDCMDVKALRERKNNVLAFYYPVFFFLYFFCYINCHVLGRVGDWIGTSSLGLFLLDFWHFS